MLSTIGYDDTELAPFVATLRKARVRLIVDVRAPAPTPRTDAAQSELADRLGQYGIGYLPMSELAPSDPAQDAASAEDAEGFKQIVRDDLTTKPFRRALGALAEFQRTTNVCLMGEDGEYAASHRALITDRLQAALGIDVDHLETLPAAAATGQSGRLHAPTHRAAA